MVAKQAMPLNKIFRGLCLLACAVPLWSADALSPTAAPNQNDVSELRARIERAREEIDQLEKLIAAQREVLATPAAKPAENKGGAAPVRAATQSDTKPSPLSISIGDATLTPLGFVDATLFGRSTNLGSGIGTNFAGIPFDNTAASHLSEMNFSAQNSRVGFRIDSTVRGAKVLGYLEADFLGSAPGNVLVTSNSNTFRMRNYFVDLRKGKAEFLAGQDWSLATPNRNGLSPLPSDLFYTQNMDTNYQAGLVWSRQAQFRFTWHPATNFAIAVSLENPQQYIGGSGGLTASAVKLPAALATSVGPEFNTGGTGTAVPNLHPDIIVKAAWDPHVGGRHLHLEAASLTRSFRDAFTAGNSASFQTSSLTAESGELNANFELSKNFRLIANTFFGAGNGRYLFGLAPDVIVRADGTLSPIHSYSTVDGFEANVTKNILLYGYYGGIAISRNTALDTNGQAIGYGYSGSSSGANRTIQEATFGVTPTIWKSANSGALSLILQYSWLTRTPWSVADGAPRNAHTNMYWVDLRYTIP
jgi:hypothetical protein